jgi:hypothetical protein
MEQHRIQNRPKFLIKALFAFLSLLLMVCFCSIAYLVFFHHEYETLFFYLPQIGSICLLIWSMVILGIAIIKQKLHDWKTYLPLSILVVYLTVSVVASHVIGAWSVHHYILTPENKIWAEAMVSRTRGGWPTINNCALSDHVVVLPLWSFVTLDGHMPVIAWSDNGVPNLKLPSNPQSCKQIDAEDPKWYFCYLDKPYQLQFYPSGLCDLR